MKEVKVLRLFCSPPANFTFLYVTFSVLSRNNAVRFLCSTFSDDQENLMVPLRLPVFVAANTQCVYMHSLVGLQLQFDYAVQSDNCNYSSIHAGQKIGLLAEACHTPVR